ncbi:MAG TPA: hypothetical protein VFS20_07000, partial [Longimicrobium sp.]|nr:hypothetical protein [Longimicrobium sp.]
MLQIRAGVRPRGQRPAPGRSVGVDVGERRTRVVVVEAGAQGPAVAAWSDDPTPPGIFVSGRPARPAELAQWLRKVLAPARAGDGVWAACPWTDVQVKRLSVPDPANRDATLRGLAVNPAFRMAADAAVWRIDYDVIDAGSGAVLAAAAKPAGVRMVAAAVAEAGAVPAGVGVAETAAAHAWLATAPEPQARALLVEAGFGGATLVVMDGGRVVAVRRVMFGGRALEERGGWDGASRIPAELAEEWAARIAQEVRMLAGAAFRTGVPGVPTVVLMGGLASSGELVEALGKVVESAVERW